MDIAIVAPCPIPYQIGGAENLCRGLQDHVNEATPHQAEILKLPSRELSFWELIASYEDFSRFDLTGFDLVVSSKYPAWMVEHPNHVVYMLHRLRGLYDAYDSFGLPREVPDPPAPVRELRAFMAATAGRPESLPELFDRLRALRAAQAVPVALEAFPGPLIREIVHHLDAIGLAPERIRRFGAISRTVKEREGYFPDGADVFVAYPPTELERTSPRRRFPRPRARDYVFTASRLDGPKRVDLLIGAMAHAGPRVRLVVAGTGPEEPRLRELAAGDDRIELRGRVPAAELAALYAGALAVAFVPLQEDFGMITLEAMQAGKAVLTCTDSGGTTELVEPGRTGLVVAPDPAALGAAMDELVGDRRRTAQMGRAGEVAARTIDWDAVLTAITSAQ